MNTGIFRYQILQHHKLRWCVLLGLLLLCFTTMVSAQTVESISSEAMNDVAADEVYWQVSVKCLDVDEPRLMQQRSGGGAWCAVQIPQLCNEDKMAIAAELCLAEYELFAAPNEVETEPEQEVQEEAVAETEPEPVVIRPAPVTIVSQPVVRQAIVTQPVVSEPVVVVNETPLVNNDGVMTAEQIAIEEELIRIEEEMLSIKLEEIELQEDEQLLSE